MMKTLRMLWSYNSKNHRNLVLALICSFIRSTVAITEILSIMMAVLVLTGSIPVKVGMIHIAAFAAVCVLASYASSYFEQLENIKSAMFMTRDQRNDVARHLRKVPLGLFRKSTSERMTATLTTTLTGIEMASSMTLVGIISGLFNSLAMFLFMMFYDWRIGIVTGLGIVVYLLIVRWQMKNSRRDAPLRQEAQTKLAASALAFVRGIRVTKAFCPGKGDDDLNDAIDASSRENIGLTDKSMPSQTASHLAIAVFESLILILTVWFTVETKEFELSKSIVLLIFSFISYSALDQAGSILSMIGMIESGLDEVEDIKKTPVLDEEPDPAVPSGDRIELENVHFSYGEREIIRGVSAVFEPGTLTAVIGPSGAGKTTLLSLIARFHDVNEGSIKLGGVDIRDMSFDELMKRMSIVFQNVYLFEDTILENIRFGRPDASLDEVRAAAKAARCDEFIMGLPDGYDTMVEEGGRSLSGGEKQRISIARAILKDAPIIILDEATNALDAENEDCFFRAVDELTKEKTVIMIAHRLSSVEHADRILALRDGLIVEEGTPAELRERDGLYKDFLDSRKKARGWKL